MGKLDGILDKWEKQERAPRESCAERLRYRRQLTYIVPGYGGKVGAFWVKRTLAWDEYSYKIDDFELTLDETLDIVMGRAAAPSVFDVMPIVTAPAPREFGSAIDHSVPFTGVQMPLPLFAGIESAA